MAEKAGWFWALVLLGGFCVLPAAPAAKLPPGVQYEARETPGPLRVHWVTLDPRQVRIALARALNDGVGREKVSSIARRKGAVAAFNAGFFSISDRYDGDPAGILKIGPDWLSSSSIRRGALGWTEDGSRTLIGEIALRCRVQLGSKNLPVAGLNRERGRGETILYSWAFHRSTLTDPGGLELALRDGEIVEISRSGDLAIPQGGHVVSFGPGTDFDASSLKPGSPARTFFQIESFDELAPSLWETMDYIVSGAPLLLRKGSVGPLDDRESGKQRHPRTAVGIRSDGAWVVLVADGRQPGLSRGMTFEEAALALKSRGCDNAINLDGGGSTTLYLAGEVVNTPSDFGIERPVSDAIVVAPR